MQPKPNIRKQKENVVYLLLLFVHGFILFGVVASAFCRPNNLRFWSFEWQQNNSRFSFQRPSAGVCPRRTKTYQWLFWVFKISRQVIPTQDGPACREVGVRASVDVEVSRISWTASRTFTQGTTATSYVAFKKTFYHWGSLINCLLVKV